MREWLERAAATSAGQYNVSISTLNRLPLCVPPFIEQRRIVAEVERRLSVVAALEREVEAALARAARLRQSILKHAFEGRLVRQDPHDEPASALLERIRAARGSPATGGKKTKTRQMPLPMI
jgi:type I restriction enzyme S subunit